MTSMEITYLTGNAADEKLLGIQLAIAVCAMGLGVVGVLVWQRICDLRECRRDQRVTGRRLRR